MIEPYRMLAFTWQWDGEPHESQVSVELAGNEGQTSLLVTHSGFADESAAENHAQGWADCLDRLPVWLASPART